MGKETPVFLGPLWARYYLFRTENPTQASAIVLVLALVAFMTVSWLGIFPHVPGPDDEPVYINTVAGFVPFAIYTLTLYIGLIGVAIILVAFVITLGKGWPAPPVWYWRMLREHPVWSVIGTVVYVKGIELYINLFG